MSALAYAVDPADDAPLGAILHRLGAPEAGAVLVVAQGEDARALTPALLARVSDAVLRLSEERREQAIDTLVALHLEGAGRSAVEQDLIDDNARLRTLVDTAMQVDPRLKRIKQEEKEARETKKRAKSGQPAGPTAAEKKKAEEEEKKKAEEDAEKDDTYGEWDAYEQEV